jgi:GTP-binding protein Era
MVRQKANATRKRSNAIVMHGKAQIIFVDTPGLHEREKLLNKFMLEEAMRAMGDADLILYLAPVTDSIENYERFLALNDGKVKHIVALTKVDQVSQEKLLKKISLYNHLSDHFEALIPVAIPKKLSHTHLLDVVASLLPNSPYLYDPDDLTSELVRDIYAGFIQEAIFAKVSDEVPYESDVLIEKIIEEGKVDKIFAKIILQKESQKPIVIGKGGESIKRIGKYARAKIEELSEKQCFLDLEVVVKKNWSKDKEYLKEAGYTQ